jgi:hypothetical protein
MSENHARAAKFLQFSDRIAGVRINVMMRALFFRQRLFVLPAAERDGFESHLPRILNYAEQTD